MRARLESAALAAGVFAASCAAADVYKCTGPQGQVTYSESPCPGQPSVKMDVRPPSDNRDAGRPPDPVPPAVAPPGGAATAAPLVAPVPALAPGGYELSYSERQRIANLEQIEKLTTAYREQRQAATLEIANIRRGVVARMSADDLVKTVLGRSQPPRGRAPARCGEPARQPVRRLPVVLCRPLQSACAARAISCVRTCPSALSWRSHWH